MIPTETLVLQNIAATEVCDHASVGDCGYFTLTNRTVRGQFGGDCERD